MSSLHKMSGLPRARLFLLLLMSIALAFSLAHMSCANGEEPDISDEPGFSEEAVSELTRSLLSVFTKSEAPGMVVLIRIPEKGVYEEAFGLSDINTGADLNAADRFRIASITKTFVGTVILQLCEEEIINMEDYVSEYIDGIPDGNMITIRMLCNNTSGIFDYTEDEGFQEDTLQNPLKKWNPEELVGIALLHPAYSKPGEEWNYSNTNYLLLGMIIERVTGSRVEDEITKRIIEPLGLSDTSFPEEPEMEGRHARGYLKEEESDRLLDHTEIDPSVAWAAGGMISNAHDLERWAEAISKGELLSSESQRERMDFFETPDLGGYGIGISKTGELIGHGGGITGYTSLMLYTQDEEAFIVVLVNMFSEEMTLIDDVMFKIMMSIKSGALTK